MNKQEILLALVRNVICGEPLDDNLISACTPEMLESVSQSLSVEASSEEPAQTKGTTTVSISTEITVTAAEPAASVTTTATATAPITTTATTAQKNTATSALVPDTSAVPTMEQTEPVATEQSSVSSETVEITVPAVSVTQSISEYDVVYWSEGGTVYHITDQCSTLRRSKMILHGTVEEALAAKKERPCKTCTKN